MEDFADSLGKSFELRTRTALSIIDLIKLNGKRITNVPYKMNLSDFEGEIFLLAFVRRSIDKMIDRALKEDFKLRSLPKCLDNLFLESLDRFLEQADENVQEAFSKFPYNYPEEFVLNRVEYYQDLLEIFYKGKDQIPVGMCLSIFQRPLQEIDYIKMDDGNLKFTGSYPDIDLKVIADFTHNVGLFIDDFQREVESIIGDYLVEEYSNN